MLGEGKVLILNNYETYIVVSFQSLRSRTYTFIYLFNQLIFEAEMILMKEIPPIMTVTA